MPPGGRVLDCACGIGQLAVGLALCGFDVVASDASPAMGALLDPSGKATTTAERLSFWPFTHTDLDEELRRTGLIPESSTYADDVDRYPVAARRVTR